MEARYPVSLTDTQIRKAKPKDRQYRLSDGDGLHLLVKPNGSKLWQMRYWIEGKEKTLSFGSYPVITLSEARDKRLEARRTLAKDLDRGVEKKRAKQSAKNAKAQTFEVLAEEYLAKQVAEERAPRTIEKNRWLLSKAVADFGGEANKDIDAAVVLASLRKVEARGNFETANRLKSLIGAVFRYGVSIGVAHDDPTKALKGALIRPRRQHRAAITDPSEFGRLLRTIETYEGQKQTRLALKLLALMVPRPGELQNARWSEFDLDKRVWVISAERMKMRSEHRIPIADQALDLLEELRELTGWGELLLPSLRSPKRPMSENTLNQALRNLGFSRNEMTAHGFRTTFSTLANESGLWNPDAIERALAHADQDDVRRAYARGEYWEERVRLAQWWGDEAERFARLNLA